jgi:hypothetical protein
MEEVQKTIVEPKVLTRIVNIKRGIIEKAIDRLEFGFRDIEAYQEITPIENMEEFLLRCTFG